MTFVNEGWLRYTGTTPRGGARGELVARRAPRRRAGGARVLGARARGASACGSASTACARQTASTAGSSTAACRATRAARFAGYVGHRDRHPRAQDDGGAACARSTSASTTIAETLQRSLLPERLPRIEGVELAARYLPGRHTAPPIGGDWYDALERPDGRVALVVGDVVGHGLRAAATMGQLRNAFRAYGLAEASPAEVMARVNRLVMSGEEEVMATVALPRAGSRDRRGAVRQRRPPAAARAGGRTGRASSRAGARSRSAPPTRPCSARRRAMLAAGLGAAALHRRPRRAPRRAARATGSTRSRRPPARSATIWTSSATRCWTRVLGDADAGRRRGAARGAPAARREPTRSRSRLPAEPESLAGLRRRLGRFLHAAGAAEAEAYEITLTVCEAAGNAIEHAYGPGDADLRRRGRASTGGELVATVRDRGTWRERRGAHRGRGLKIIEGLMDDV